MGDVWIQLTRGMKAVIDAEDYALVSQYKWRAIGSRKKKFYAETGRNRDRILMHRLILGLPQDVEGDHKDGDGLNNRRNNIREATRSQNNMNRRSWTGSYKGVLAVPAVWKAVINVGKRKLNLGTFAIEEDAARAYDEAALKYHGEFASLNFRPDTIPPLPSNAGMLAGLV
jgi:hypothetical protein